MSITSKIVLSALLVGITVPAFAQTGSVSGAAVAHKPVVTTHAPQVHKVASTTDVTKPGAAVSAGTAGTTVNTGIAGSTKPAVKPELGKTDTMKTDAMKTDAMKTDAVKTDAMKTDAPKVSATTGVAASTKPLAPAVSGTTTVAPKTN